jgi:mRNA interferase MazF
MPSEYVPDRGDLVWLRFDPQAGHEQAGTRPALVISPRAYNRKVGLALCCPVTSQIKGYPFEVNLPTGLRVQGAVLSDQVKSLDWRVRKARLAGKAPVEVMEEVVGRILAIVDLDSSR